MSYPHIIYHLSTHLGKAKRWALSLACALLMVACSESDKPTNLEPHLSTLSATDITRNEATLNGLARVEGETAMPQLTFRYGTSESMSETSKALTPQVGDSPNEASVELRLMGLVAGTTYYYSLQGTNGRTLTTSNMRSFSTKPNEKPKLGELSVLSHGPMSVIVGYDIEDDGGENVTETGCYYALTANKDDASKRQKLALQGYTGNIGKQQVCLNDLQRNSSYQIWPYAKSRAGERIGNPITFTTSDAILLGEAGMLSQIMGSQLYEYTSLSIAGPLNGDDVSCIRKMMGRNTDDSSTPGKLSDIDLSDAHIVAGGGSYGASRYTKNNVIGQGMFANCDHLTHIILPSDAITLERDVFAGCTSLRQIEVPASVSVLLPSSGCTALQAISVSGANPHYLSQDGVLLNASGTEIVWFPMGKTGNYTLPSTILAIGDYAFRECSITKFILPDNIKEIGRGAFLNSKVEEVKLPDNLQIVTSATFQGCTHLKTVHIGSKTNRIAEYVFDECPLADIYVDAAYPPTCDEKAFATKGEDFLTTCTLHVPTGKKALYRNHKSWGNFKNIVEK